MKYEMPPALTGIPVLKKAYEIILEEVSRFEEMVKRLEREIHTDTATDEGLSHKEKVFSLSERETDTLAERRKRIEVFEKLLGYNSLGEIEKIIKGIAGEESEVTRELSDTTGGVVRVFLALTSEKNLDDIRKKLSGVLPAPMSLEVGVKFRRFSEFSDKTYAENSDKTYNELKRKDD